MYTDSCRLTLGNWNGQVLTNLASQVMAQLKEGMEGNALKVQ